MCPKWKQIITFMELNLNERTMMNVKNIGAILFALCLLGSCSEPVKLGLDDYQPTTEFKPAFDNLSKYVSQNKDCGYDIEMTVRAMNSIEIAQTQSEDFLNYLEYLAKEDYHGVAPEVIEAKIHLFPILQKMTVLKQQHSELNDIWTLAQCAAKGVANSTSAEDVKGSVAALTASSFATPVMILNLSNGAVKATGEAFKEYDKARELSASLKKEIEALRLAYIDYLTLYAPIYHKYMKEWDNLCLKKDKAYLETYAGRCRDACVTTEDILNAYPNNREALLLNAIAHINMAKKNNSSVFNLPAENPVGDSLSERNEHIVKARGVIERYLSLYPGKSAPALVVTAMAEFATGNADRAMSCLDQAAIEYPKQAEELKDLLNSYKFRSYLNQTPEGQYLLRLYHSTMEGYGLFSPNFQKAAYYEHQGDLAKSSTEIYNHFFRRGNQGIYDCLLSDMEFCEKNLETSFKNILIEHSYVDLNIKPETDWKFGKKDDEITVKLSNRSDLDFENVRLFLCIHYTDMYVDEYDIVKSSSVNVIKPHSSAEFDNIKLNYRDKKYTDVTRIRAIAMTDNKICWIDAPEYKIMHASKKSASEKNEQGYKDRREMLKKNFKIDEDKVKSLLSNINVPTVQNKSRWSNIFSSEKMHVELPRILTYLSPVFSVNELQTTECKLPLTNVLGGSNILLEFDIEPKDGTEYPLYMYSDFFDCKVNIKFENGKVAVSDVTLL